MKKFFALTSLFFIALFSSGQILKPVKWTFSVEQKDKNEATLIFSASIEKGWHIYSQNTPDGGPMPMMFTFEKGKGFDTIGKVTEPKPHEEFDDVFGVKVLTFDGDIRLSQKIKLSGDGATVKGAISGQVCKESCILFDTTFVFKIGNGKSEIPKVGKKNTASVAPVDTAKILPDVTVSQSQTSNLKPQTSNSPDTAAIVPSAVSNLALEKGCGSDLSTGASHDMSFITIFLTGMVGGLLALLTPCVFPMVPLTVSFFTKQSRTRKKAIAHALVYAGSIIVLYVVLGLLVTVLFGSDALNDLASSGFFNLLFFIIFLVFAISFFGAFEITLPSSWINKADSASDRGGLIGIFFMAFTLALVSFSCTGPIIGTLLVEAANGRSYIGPIAGMFGFSFALAVPFAVFSMFPNLLQALPKSGGWLNTVKVCLGFLELALALKFLSNVDLAYHWNILHREIFVVLWIIIFGLMGFYLLGKIRLSHDSEVTHVSISRLMFALLAFSFALYLTPGIWGAPLKLISGFPPPEFYKEWKTTKTGDCPHDLACFHDLDEGLRYARLQHKPLMIDFTGWSCVNCRKMEDNVWSDEKVLKRLSEDYVLVSLYVDDKQLLPEGQQTVSATTGKKIKTTGNKWSDLQANVYNTNSQPYYVLLDNKGKILARPRGYTPDIKEYLSYLDEGLCRYEKRKAGEKNLAEK